MLIDDIMDYAEGFSHYAPLILDDLDEAPESICFRQNSSTKVTEIFMDGSFDGELEFSILCKSKNRLTAMNQLELYKDVFKINTGLVLSSGRELLLSSPILDTELYALSENGDSVYEISILISYYEG